MSLKVDGEIEVDTEPCLLAWSDQLFVGCEDGTIKSYNASLTPGASWSAHGVQLFALEAGGGRVYSSSNDGAVRVWSPCGDKLAELKTAGSDVGALRLSGDELYAGDEAGGVLVFEKDELKATYHVLEEVKDIALCKPFMMTVRDLDVTVTEIKPDSSKFRFTTQLTMEGRAPIKIAGTSLLLVTRDGRSIRLHHNSIDTKFKLLHEQKVSEMILTSLAVSEDGCVVWSAGWDGRIRRWTIGDSTLTAAGEIEIGACVNSIVTSQEADVVYAAVSGGKIIRVRA